MSTVTPEARESANSQVMGLTLQQLKAVARNDGLPVSGPKATLQERIKDRLSEYARRDEMRAFFRLQTLISNPNAPPPPDTGGRWVPPSSSHSKMSGPPARLNFRTSPFFQIRQAVTQVFELKARESTRDTVECHIRLSLDIVDQLTRPRAGENLRLMVYSAAESGATSGQVDIAFPNQVEMKINGDDVKANLKGLKNKPGSTRPADITDMIHKKVNYANIWTILYALTTKKFQLVVNLVNKVEPAQLIEEIKRRPRLSKDQVIRDMINRNEDSDIQATSSVMSLKCPLSHVRLDLPCRSDICLHNQCFDAMSFLQLQEQAPLWQCPICNKIVQWQSLRIDNYVADIVSSSPRDVEQVTIEPNGRWTAVAAESSNGRGSGGRGGVKNEPEDDDDDEDDDLVEIQEPLRLAASHSQPLWTPPGMSRTPPHSSREPSINSATTRSSAKRPVSAVIDLTASSDEDEEPVRPPKRHAAYQPTPPVLHSYDGADGQSQRPDAPPHRPPITFSVQARQSQPSFGSSWRGGASQNGGSFS